MFEPVDAGSQDPEIAHEQAVVDATYHRLDQLKDEYRLAQERAHRQHGVGNAQGFTERDVLSAHFSDLRERLDQVEDRLVFGRIDMEDDLTHYVGRIGISTAEGEPMLIDWRAPASRPFYQATAIDPQGVIRRRHLTTRARRVTAIEDEALDQEAANKRNMTLQGEGALMSALSEARQGHMTDIVSTIQAEQDSVIRSEDSGLVIVQGGPGTGKTAVALHRAAYLLYTQRDRLQHSGVLLIGPSHVFLRYIEQVLPSLGETGVVSVTMGDLLPGFHAQAHDSERVARIKGKAVWQSIIRRAVKGLQCVPDADQELRVWSRTVTLTVEDIRAAHAHARRTGKPHNEARDGFALELMDVLARRLAADERDRRSREGVHDVDGNDVEMWRQEIRDSVDARRAINLAWMPTSPLTLLERIFARPGYLEQLNASVPNRLTFDEIAGLRRPKGSPLTVSDIPLLDECAELLGTSSALRERENNERAERLAYAREAIERQNLGDGIVTAQMLADATCEGESHSSLAERARRDRSWTYGHIVVDEAQELSPMAWRALLRRCPSRSFTVVGDLDQRRGHDRPSTWHEALGPAARALSEEYVLTISYRTPRQLIDRAQRVMAAVGEPMSGELQAVRDVTDAYELTHLAQEHQPPSSPETDDMWEPTREAIRRELSVLDHTVGIGRGRLAIIMGSERADQWNADTDGHTTLSERVAVLSATAAKGLEFDSVIVVEPSEILGDGPGDLFVALTRSTQRLHIVSSGQVLSGLEQN